MSRTTLRRPGTLSVPFRRAHDFRLLMAGSCVSMLGSRMTTIACPLLALYLTDSPLAAGLVAFSATVPSILAYIPAGALVDHWDPRRTMILSEFGCGTAIATIVIRLAMGRPSILLLVAVVVVDEVLKVFSTLAERRYVRSLMPPAHMSSSVQANIEARSHVVVLGGRPLGTFLFSLQPILPFLADALSFVVSISFIASLKDKQVVTARVARVSRRQLRNDISEGLVWLLHDSYARAAMTLSACTTLIGQALIIIFLVEAHASRMPSVTMGLALAASGGGGVLGSMLASRLPAPPKASLILVQMITWVVALAFLALLGWRSFPCMAIVMAVQSITGALGNIEIDTYINQNVDENMLGRVTSIGRLIAFSAFAVGPMLGGILVQLYGAQNAIIVLFTMTSTAAAIAACTPSIRLRGTAITAAAEDRGGCDTPAGQAALLLAGLSSPNIDGMRLLTACRCRCARTGSARLCRGFVVALDRYPCAGPHSRQGRGPGDDRSDYMAAEGQRSGKGPGRVPRDMSPEGGRLAHELPPRSPRVDVLPIGSNRLSARTCPFPSAKASGAGLMQRAARFPQPPWHAGVKWQLRKSSSSRPCRRPTFELSRNSHNPSSARSGAPADRLCMV